MAKGRVLMAMSGGVDSSVSAACLLEEGYELVGATMLLHHSPHDEAKNAASCCSNKDVEDAKAVARTLGFEHHVLDFGQVFERAVVDQFCQAYLLGSTPNPCIECNRHLKFAMLQKARLELGCDFVATGHYARRRQNADGSYSLLRGLDVQKDQSYVLYHLSQDTLAHMLFPLGTMTKQQVRALAARTCLANAEKAESQDICFVPDGDYAGFIEHRTARQSEPGPIVDEDGNELGRHLGLIRYTVGQRKGLNLGGGTAPYYVLAKDASTNTLVVGSADRLLSRTVTAHDINIISGVPWEGARSVDAKIGYRMKAAPARACVHDGLITVEFEADVRAVSPGQSLVLYSGEEVLGGGYIKSAV